MLFSVPGVNVSHATRLTLIRGVLLPSWIIIALVVLPFWFGVSVPPVVQYIPLVISILLLGLPHGAIDHFALPRVRGRHPTWRAIGFVFLVYAILSTAYALGWFLLPAAALIFFILMTWAHWGQGDLYAMLAFTGANYLQSQVQRVLAVLVRGGLPMLVPLLSFPEWYRRVATRILSLFGIESITTLDWVFQTDTRVALEAGFTAVVVGYLVLGYRRATKDSQSTLVLDAGETLLLGIYFLTVPPVLAIGVYFCVWHSYRHIARLILLEPESHTAIQNQQLWPGLRRFMKEATPLTLASLGILAGFYVLVPNAPTNLFGWISLYLVLLAVITLPHVVIVGVMDYEQSVWIP